MLQRDESRFRRRALLVLAVVHLIIPAFLGLQIPLLLHLPCFLYFLFHFHIIILLSMGWFGGSSSDTSDDAPPPKSFDDGSAAFSSSDAGIGMSSGNDMQDFGMALQQQLIVQQVISQLTDTAFQKCITGKPSDSLSGSNVACIHSTVNKWMDTNEFMMGRLAKKQQQRGGGGY
jgi:hypothetical protein